MNKEENKALKEFSADYARDGIQRKISNTLTWKEFIEDGEEIKNNPDYCIKIYEPLRLARVEYLDDVYYFVDEDGNLTGKGEHTLKGGNE